MATVLATMPSPLMIKVTKTSDSFDEELREQDLDFGYESDMTDDSSYLSPVGTPTSAAKVASSPCAVDDVVLAAPATWSAPTVRRKRSRMSEDERRVRHREVQREFMKRKRARIAVLRKEQCGVEKQLRLVRVLHEVEQLKKENEFLKQQYEVCEQAEPESSSSAPVAAMNFDDLVFSVPSEETHEDFVMTEEDWTVLYDMLSGDSNDCDDSLLSETDAAMAPKSASE